MCSQWCYLCDKLDLSVDRGVLSLEAFKSWTEGDLSLKRLTLVIQPVWLTQTPGGLLLVQSAGSLSGRGWGTLGIRVRRYISYLDSIIKMLVLQFWKSSKRCIAIIWMWTSTFERSVKKVVGMFQVWICPFGALSAGQVLTWTNFSLLLVSEILTHAWNPACADWGLALSVALSWHSNETVSDWDLWAEVGSAVQEHQ